MHQQAMGQGNEGDENPKGIKGKARQTAIDKKASKACKSTTYKWQSRQYQLFHRPEPMVAITQVLPYGLEGTQRMPYCKIDGKTKDHR